MAPGVVLLNTATSVATGGSIHESCASGTPAYSAVAVVNNVASTLPLTVAVGDKIGIKVAVSSTATTVKIIDVTTHVGRTAVGAGGTPNVVNVGISVLSEGGTVLSVPSFLTQRFNDTLVNGAALSSTTPTATDLETSGGAVRVKTGKLSSTGLAFAETYKGACISASLSPVNPSAAAGTVVTLTARSSGCPSPQYEFWVQYPSGTWNLKQAFGAAATFNWNTAGLTPGTYNVHVWANNLGDSTATFEALGSDQVALTGCTSAAISPATGTATAGSTVVFTASAGGCINPVYEWWLQDPSGIWHLMQPFSFSTTWTWNSATGGWPKGTYNIHVWANAQGADTSTFEAFGPATYTLT
jgi:hypothetical protein